LLAPVIACHHWISVTANAGDANASVAAATAAAPNRRKIIKAPPGWNVIFRCARYQRRMTFK
jgi:hypothetical protein